MIPIGDDGQGVGNLPRADRFGAESISTFNFDPIGWKGAKLDLTLGGEWTSVKDPLTGEKRPISGNSGSLGQRPDPPRHPGHAARVERLCPAPALREELLS